MLKREKIIIEGFSIKIEPLDVNIFLIMVKASVTLLALKNIHAKHDNKNVIETCNR